MRIKELISRLQDIEKDYGDIDVIIYDRGVSNTLLVDSEITDINVLNRDNDKGCPEDYVEIAIGEFLNK